VRRVALLLSFLGAPLVVFALSKVHAAAIADPPYDFTGSSRFAWAISYIVLLWLATYALGLPDLPRSLREAVGVSVAVSASAAIAVSLLQLVVGDALLPRFVVLGTALVLVPWQVAANAIARSGHTRGESRDRVLLIGADDELERLTVDLGIVPERPAALVAHLTPGRAASEGSVQPIIDIVLANQVSVIVLDRAAQADDEVVGQAALLHEAGVRVRTLVQFYEEWLGKLPVGELDRASMFFDISEIHGQRYARIKRLMDLGLAVVGLVPFVLSIPFVLLANLFANRGPLFYRQERVGREGVTFRILKFRTMRADGRPDGSDADGSDWTAVGDPRVTPFGKVLRATHLDELPQVVNIVKGELAVVGPRPEQPRYVRELSASLPFYGMRHLVRPGLTGWAQVKYGYAGDEDDALEKLQYEFFYLNHQGIGLDLRIVGRTLRAVLGSQGGGR
jgi:lipopolysaccharide/colanic/teichoic acid biosynthesis glycosyltransferase